MRTGSGSEAASSCVRLPTQAESNRQSVQHPKTPCTHEPGIQNEPRNFAGAFYAYAPVSRLNLCRTLASQHTECQDAWSKRKSIKPHISSMVFSPSAAIRSDSHSSGHDSLHG